MIYHKLKECAASLLHYFLVLLHSSQALLVTCHAQNSYTPLAAKGYITRRILYTETA